MTSGYNKYVPLAVAMILFILAALGLRLWSSNRAFLIEGPANIHQGPDGLVYIVNDAKLYIHDTDGILMESVPLERFGLEKARGDFWIFRNGDLLLRKETTTKLSCKRELETYFRDGSSKQDGIDSSDGILQRCNIRSYICLPFGSGQDAFKKIGAFKVFIDEDRDNVYITDTPAHQLLLYNLQGELKRKSDARFLYPNGVVGGSDGLLYIADTNHHEIVAVDPSYNSLGNKERRFSILNTISTPDKQWPFALGQDRNNRWWVLNAGNDMRYGDLVIYDESGNLFKRVELPENADPTAVAVLADRVLVTDPSLMRVYSVALNGELQEDFGSLTFKIDGLEKLRERNLYMLLSSLMLYAVLLGAIAAIIVAWKAQLASAAQSKEQAAQSIVAEKEEGPDPGSDMQIDQSVDSNSRSEAILVPYLPASQGWTWFSDALMIVKKSFRIYAVLFLVTLLQWQGVVRIPKVGYLLLIFLSPLLIGILMMISQRVVKNNDINVRKVKIRSAVISLLFVGGAYCLVLGLCAGIALLMTGQSAAALVILGMSSEVGGILSPESAVSLLMTALVLLVILFALSAASWFAPPLIVFKGLSGKNAMTTSFKAVFRNFGAFSLFSIVLGGIFLVALVSMIVIPGILFIPLGLTTFIKPMSMVMGFLFWPMISPFITLSIYTSYVRIFESNA